MATYFRARDRREVPAIEALDARGVLKSGYGRRVPAQMQDAASRFNWGAQRESLVVTGTEGNRPGFRVLSDSNPGRQAIADAHAAPPTSRIWNPLGALRREPIRTRRRPKAAPAASTAHRAVWCARAVRWSVAPSALMRARSTPASAPLVQARASMPRARPANAAAAAANSTTTATATATAATSACRRANGCARSPPTTAPSTMCRP